MQGRDVVDLVVSAPPPPNCCSNMCKVMIFDVSPPLPNDIPLVGGFNQPNLNPNMLQVKWDHFP